MHKAVVTVVGLVSLVAIPTTLHYGGYLEARLDALGVKGEVILDGRSSGGKVDELLPSASRNE